MCCLCLYFCLVLYIPVSDDACVYCINFNSYFSFVFLFSFPLFIIIFQFIFLWRWPWIFKCFCLLSFLSLLLCLFIWFHLSPFNTDFRVRPCLNFCLCLCMSCFNSRLSLCFSLSYSNSRLRLSLSALFSCPPAFGSLSVLFQCLSVFGSVYALALFLVTSGFESTSLWCVNLVCKPLCLFFFLYRHFKDASTHNTPPPLIPHNPPPARHTPTPRHTCSLAHTH